MASGKNDPFFRPIGDVVENQPDSGAGGQASGAQQQVGQDVAAASGDAQEPKMIEEIESLCMRCQENGMTRLLLTYIPYFREVIIASFQCDHCGERNNEIQSAGQIQGASFFFQSTASFPLIHIILSPSQRRG
jgi:zinc finger protein